MLLAEPAHTEKLQTINIYLLWMTEHSPAGLRNRQQTQT
jgi:hypothetical protein